MPGVYLYGWDSAAEGWVKIKCDANGKLEIDPTLILENPPTEDEAKKAPTSEWAFDHKADAAAHHAKYTNLDAQTACKLNGTLYWSCAGIAFSSLSPDVDDVTKGADGKFTVNTTTIYALCPVNLPHGATITGVIVYGNAAIEAETWWLSRLQNNNLTRVNVGSAVFNTEDTSLYYATVNNSAYSYFFRTSSLDTADEIWGARITYTL